ncbi:metallophosphoesterase family protein [Levilactobacillus suantsaii]|uniref:Metallophosphoesterase n=1 Tax=Levilactobacillus suantsaii TaxID=2292255 RepID=A0A4Q0VI14_9LACO|nr:metallophosphoesterase family protein [Levilactobacillus suantsaii]QMU07708.1 metallophosphoesterase family protein [Levilactobacillus suantsaii]RXI78686.1 metallophosphoesterase [Levilactobacillus suantsaii]
MTKIALISDVHGDVTALKAVVADAKQAGCTVFWLIGDLFLPGPGAHDLLALLDSLPLSAYVRGNWEDNLLEAIDGPIQIHRPRKIYLAILGDAVRAQLTTADIKRLHHLPLVQTRQVDGLQFQLSHNLPTQNYGKTLRPVGEQTAFDQLVGTDADVAVYGHTHQQLLRWSSAGQLVINPGTVGMPYPDWPSFSADLRAQYAIVTTHGPALPDVDFRRVSYDVDAELALATQRHWPYLELYVEQLRHGMVNTHDAAALTALTERLHYAPWLAAILRRTKTP